MIDANRMQPVCNEPMHSIPGDMAVVIRRDAKLNPQLRSIRALPSTREGRADGTYFLSPRLWQCDKNCWSLSPARKEHTGWQEDRGHRSDSSRSLSSYGLLTQLRELPFMRIFYM